MGLFSIYTGLIYNDVFSRAFNIFGSSYDFEFQNATGKWIGKYSGSPYIFGVDPVRHTHMHAPVSFFIFVGLAHV